MIKITKLTERCNVYDITVHKNHNFFANNILVHNCTEVTLSTKATTYEANNDRKIKEYGETAVCNLGSINLANHIDDKGSIDYDKLAQTIEIGARMLDNVIDINFYPTQEAKNSNKKHRPVGMGSMGWADIFLKKKIAYDSDEAIRLSSEIYEFISYHSILASSKLAKERGKYESYEGSLWSKNTFPIDTYAHLMSQYRDQYTDSMYHETLDWSIVRKHVEEYGMRNSNTECIAPTASISYIVGCSPCTEPIFNPIFVYKNMSGDFTIVNEHLVNDLKERGLWNNQTLNKLKSSDGDVSVLGIPELTSLYKSAFDIDQFKLLDAAQARGKWIDQAMSVNLFNNKTSLKYLSDLYMHAWKIGLKTTYYLRNRAASAIEKASIRVEKVVDEVEEVVLGPACSRDNPDCESCS